MDSLKISSETTTLVDLVEDSLFKFIKEQNLKPGDKLLAEDELSERLGVGRNVVREALSRLRFLGILDTRKRRGIILQEPDLKKNLEKLINPQMLSWETIINLLELRYTLEIGIIPTIFDKITDEDIREISDILNKEPANEGIRVPIDDELKFHSRIYAITGNQIIMDLQPLLIPMYRFIDENYHEFEMFIRKVKENNQHASHRDILLCLKSKNEKEYELAIKQHLMGYQLFVAKYRKKKK